MINELLKPKKIGKITVPNRMVVTAAVTITCDENGYATENYCSYYEAKARGGWGLIITEDYAVDELGKSFTRVPGLWEDGQISSHAELTERVHKYNSVIFAQIFHCGRQTAPKNIGGQTPLAPSRIIDPKIGGTPRALTTAEVEELVTKFCNAAYRAKQAGFDGVEIHAGHGYLINEFFSLYTNKRIDKYGGNILNRCRFASEIVKGIKEKCGKDFPVGMRISADEYVPGGITIEDAKVIVSILEESGIDVVNVSAGVNASIERVAPPGVVEHAPYVDMAEQIKKVVNIPVIGLGRINDPFLAESILRSGKCDFIGMLRASMADPELPNKVKEGRYEDIVTCIGCLLGCSGMLAKGQSPCCIFNPSMARETELAIKEAEVKKNVIVVGGGVSGMEAAITAAQCGHKVTLIEKDNHIGGQFCAAAVPPGKGEITSFIVWQHTQLKKQNVKVLMDTEATPELLDTLEPDVVIVATGAAPFIPPIPGADKPNVYTALQVLEGDIVNGKTGVVIGGGMVGGETAYHLACHGKKITTLLEMQDEILIGLPNNPKVYLMRHLNESGIEILTKAAAKEILDDGIVITYDGEERKIDADFIVIAAGSKPNSKLMEQLKDKPYSVYSVGDVVNVGIALDAIHDAYKLALGL